MASFIGGVYTPGDTSPGAGYRNLGQATGEESQSPDVFDHIDDFGNTGATGGWERPSSMGSAGSQFSPPVAPLEIIPVLPVFPQTARPEKFDLPGDKSLWDKITPGDSQTPGGLFDGFELPGLTDWVTPIFPAAGLFGTGAEKFVPEIKGVATMLPLIAIMMISKEK